ncbi:hypothetical protein [Vibrio parahaemolyticus]|uniref:hypothetical protein n=1 Tax=Vibrio parahaemolyticus TaxID=670 RepID=UPI0015F751C0|nr:hypothetical protein [Vibrio parahaemolyticus]EJB0234183.1 hypothetical protein [Vibrio vulnificus]ELX4139961.1 hypothetical protein [Vibrio vulnificus]MBA5907935.1 hypothetical protein [Vibrio parahaemolyticus]
MKTESLLRIERLARRLIALSALSQDGDITELDTDDVYEVLAVQQEAASEIKRLVSAEIKARSLK